MIRGAVFDLDGTLLDSMSVWDTIGEDYLRSLGKEPRENLAEAFRTFTLPQAAEYYQAHYGVALPAEEIIEGVNAMIADRYLHSLPLKKGVPQFLEELRKRGVRMCAATATDHWLAKAALERCGVVKYFSRILTCSEYGSKDTPRIYREALRVIGTEKKETVVFEDAWHALRTAKTDGFLCAAVYDAHESRQADMQRAADVCLEDFTAFEDFWHRIRRAQKSS